MIRMRLLDAIHNPVTKRIPKAVDIEYLDEKSPMWTRIDNNGERVRSGERYLPGRPIELEKSGRRLVLSFWFLSCVKRKRKALPKVLIPRNAITPLFGLCEYTKRTLDEVLDCKRTLSECLSQCLSRIHAIGEECCGRERERKDMRSRDENPLQQSSRHATYVSKKE
jgi:hypothetical protein